MSLSQSIHWASGRAATVLVVEDEVLIRMILVDYLEDCGFKVLEAANADEAIAIICRPAMNLDLVFTDVRMPGTMDGFGLATWLQNSKPDLRVMLTSGDVGQVNAARRGFLGEAFFAKPYSLELVAAKITQSLAVEASKTPT